MKNRIYIQKSRGIPRLPQGTAALIRRCCDAVLEDEAVAQRCEISVSLVTNAQIAELNNHHRQKNTPTDVLSFPLGEKGVYDTDPITGALLLGDIVISVEKALEQTAEYGHSIEREIAFLTVHSMYHLLGYDHEGSANRAKTMRQKEEATLSRLGILRSAAKEQTTGEAKAH